MPKSMGVLEWIVWWNDAVGKAKEGESLSSLAARHFVRVQRKEVNNDGINITELEFSLEDRSSDNIKVMDANLFQELGWLAAADARKDVRKDLIEYLSSPGIDSGALIVVRNWELHEVLLQMHMRTQYHTLQDVLFRSGVGWRADAGWREREDARGLVCGLERRWYAEYDTESPHSLLTRREWHKVERELEDETKKVEKLLQLGANPDAKGECRLSLDGGRIVVVVGNPAIFMAGAMSNENGPAVVNLLLKHGCDPNATNRYGKTALMEASGNNFGLPVVLELLKDERININAVDNFGMTALMHAAKQICRSKYLEAEYPLVDIIYELVEAGADTKQPRNEPRLVQEAKRQLIIMRLLTENNLGDVAELVIKHTPRLDRSDIDGWLLGEVGDEEVVRKFAAQASAEGRELTPEGKATDYADSLNKYVDGKRKWAKTELSDERTAEQMARITGKAWCAPIILLDVAEGEGVAAGRARKALDFLKKMYLESLRWPPSDKVLDEFRRATPGEKHDDKELPKGTVVFLKHRRGTYDGFGWNWSGPNDHTILFKKDAGGHYQETIQLKGDPRWRFLLPKTAPATKKGEWYDDYPSA